MQRAISIPAQEEKNHQSVTFLSAILSKNWAHQAPPKKSAESPNHTSLWNPSCLCIEQFLWVNYDWWKIPHCKKRKRVLLKLHWDHQEEFCSLKFFFPLPYSLGLPLPAIIFHSSLLGFFMLFGLNLPELLQTCVLSLFLNAQLRLNQSYQVKFTVNF